jgi:type VI secretion system secreted protein Hcp
MANVDYFLKLDGIQGESTDAAHKGEIEILSFSWGETASVDRGGGGAGGKVEMQDFHFTANFNKASPALFQACATGRHIKIGVLTGRGVRKAGGDSFYKVSMTDIIISSYQTGGAGDAVPTDQFSLNFAKIEYNGLPAVQRHG